MLAECLEGSELVQEVAGSTLGLVNYGNRLFPEADD